MSDLFGKPKVVGDGEKEGEEIPEELLEKLRELVENWSDSMKTQFGDLDPLTKKTMLVALLSSIIDDQLDESNLEGIVNRLQWLESEKKHEPPEEDLTPWDYEEEDEEGEEDA